MFILLLIFIDTYDDILGKRETRPFGTAAWRHFVPVLTTAIIEGKKLIKYFVYTLQAIITNWT
jgi:hypothetical protein